MKEFSLIGTRIWAEQEVQRYPLLRPGSAINYAFFDPLTGEVWAKRIVQGSERSVWVYVSSPKESMDITIPWEWDHDCVPLGLLCAIVAGWKSPSQ